MALPRHILILAMPMAMTSSCHKNHVQLSVSQSVWWTFDVGHVTMVETRGANNCTAPFVGLPGQFGPYVFIFHWPGGTSLFQIIFIRLVTDTGHHFNRLSLPSTPALQLNTIFISAAFVLYRFHINRLVHRLSTRCHNSTYMPGPARVQIAKFTVTLYFSPKVYI